MIGIVTIIDNNNYGNRLQNYALAELIKKNGYDVMTLKNEIFLNEKKKYLLRKIRYLNFKGTYSENRKRKLNFKIFNKNLCFSKKIINIYSNLNKFDYIIVGSDQVWNPNFGRLREFDLLKYVEPKKRISYAASFGIDNLPEKYIEIAKKELKKFKAISVREESGKKIVDNLINEEKTEVNIDPTMLLTAEEWDRVSKKPTMLKTNKYILNYFLGEISEERKKEIERVARENDCEIINILDKNSPFYECGPSEFLYLEKNAFLICTDSFHSSVFAILYNRPFIIFDREQKNVVSMNSRLETLINKFKLKNRKFEGKITEENLKHDYTEAYKILEEERKKSEKFLRNALDIKN